MQRHYTPGVNARVDVDNLLKLLNDRGYTYQIHWRWSGWSRHAVLSIFDHDGKQCVSVPYARSTMKWAHADEQLGRVRTGSSKHAAVVAAYRRLTKHTGTRRCGGMSDTLID